MELKLSDIDLGRLIRGDWELVCGRWEQADNIGQWLTRKGDGLYLNHPEKAGTPWVHPGREGLVLPLPTFTLAQFKAFCEWHPTFEWEAITSEFTNDDGTLDEDALKELASRGEAAAALVRGVLAGADDEYLRAWETHCRIDECKAEIAELKSLKPATITERMIAKQELDALGRRLSLLTNHEAAPEPKQASEAAAVVLDSASNAPLPKAKAKRRTWKDVSVPYIVEVMRAGRYTTAKALYRVLEAKAGTGSPFEKGTGDNLGSLFVRDIAECLSLKTVQNNWRLLREQAKK